MSVCANATRARWSSAASRRRLHSPTLARWKGTTMIRLAALIALGALASSPAYAQKPQIQWDKNYDFSNVKTFQWQQPSAPSLADENPFMHKFIEESIETELQNVGFVKTEENPDVYVTYHGSVNTEVQTKVGTLVVDIVDAKEKQLVWRGTSSGILISDSQEKTEKAVGNAIKDMAKQGRKLQAKEAN